MTEVTRGEINDIVAGHAADNQRYREALVADPALVLGRQMGRRLPDFLNVEVLEETADTIYLVLPIRPKEGDELSDADLELVAGGKGGESGAATFSCQVYGAGHMGTRKEINTDLSVF